MKTSLPKERKLDLLLRLGNDKHSDEYLSELLLDLNGDESLAWHLSSAVKYLARVYLYATGDERSSGVLTYKANSDSLVVTATVPWFFALAVNTLGVIPDSLTLRTDETRPTREDGWPVYSHVWKHCYPNADLLGDDSRKLACSRVFTGLCEIIQSPEYQIDAVSFMPTRREQPFMGYAIDSILEGHIAACGKCGKPIYMGTRKNAKPFCNRGHQERYRESAQRMLWRGGSVDDVAAKFPYINPKTIANWQ